MSAGRPAVEMRAITKRFPGVQANAAVDFDLRRGEIHALLGENGAGKSTLMNILTGLYRQDGGTIHVDGRPVSLKSPRDAIAHGIGMVHQHFMLVPTQSVTENILLGLDQPRFLMQLAKYEQVIADLGKQYGLHVDPRSKIWQLSVGEQQRVEILKILYRGAQVLIMDERPRSGAAGDLELFKTLRAMVAGGKSIVFISHKLHEVMAIADRITVLRKGKVTAAGLRAAETTKEELARLMVGREVLFHLDKKPTAPGPIVLEIQDLRAENDKGLPALRGVSLRVRSGEIVGLAGIAGNGQSELAEVITGLRPASGGSISLDGKPFIGEHARGQRSTGLIRRLIGAGVSHIPEDRTHVGTAPNLSVTDNVIMKAYREKPIAVGWSIDGGQARSRAKALRESYEIMAPTVETPVRLLSGGNLQRLILAREISAQPRLMVAMQPTRGLDVGAIEGVHRLLLGQRETGAAILLVSEELEELLALSDRVYVIYAGEIMGEVRHADAATIGLMMTGTRLKDLELEGAGG
jgi:simple sugar transport system ATP-binding protein